MHVSVLTLAYQNSLSQWVRKLLYFLLSKFYVNIYYILLKIRFSSNTRQIIVPHFSRTADFFSLYFFKEISSLEEAKNLLISQKLEIQNQIDGMEEKVRKVNTCSGKYL